MAQSFPTVTQNSYIDEAILDLQDRDDAVLTCFSGNTAPSNPFENLVWNDTSHKCLKYRHGNSWETIIDYGKQYITQTALEANYQPLNSILTNYSITLASNAMGFVTPVGGWIPINSFYLTKLNSTDNIKSALGLKALAYESVLSAKDIANGSISMNKLTADIITDPVYKVGDCIPSFNRGNKSGCVKLSKSANTVFTIGATSSNSTYKGDVYKQLYQFIWSKFDLPIYTSNGVTSKKSTKNWSADWNANKQLELPHIDLISDKYPKSNTLVSLALSGDRRGDDLNTYRDFDSQKTKSGSVKVPVDGYYEVILVGGGGGSSDRELDGDRYQGYGGAGAYFKGTLLLKEGAVLKYEVGYGGRGAYSYARNHIGFDGSYTKLTSTGVSINCPGGYGGICSRREHRPSAVMNRGYDYGYWSGWSFAPEVSISAGKLVGTPSQSTTGSRKNSWYQGYGKGGDIVGGTSEGECGNNGFISINFIGPEEYGEPNTNKRNALDNLYKSLTYFMKY